MTGCSQQCSGQYQSCTKQQHQMDPQPAAQSCRQTAVTLAFRDPSVERRFKGWYDDAATAHDLQAASIYLWMVALGSLLYLGIIACSPSSRPANLDQCTVLILCSWMGPMMHLLLLRLLPRATYTRHRTHIILLFRAFYIGATSVNGFGLCGVGRLAEKKGAVAAAFHGTPYAPQGLLPAVAAAVGLGEPGSLVDASSSNRCPLESPFSAMLWRSGVIGLIWWPAAFPLPFRHHVPVQAASVALYISTLAPTVCSTMHGVRSGRAVLLAIRSFGDTFTTQLLSAMGVPGPPVRHGADVAAAAAAAAGGSSSVSSGGCVPVLAYVQVVLGLVLPAFVMYCFEARKRRSWWQDALSSNSGGGGSSGVGTGSSGGGSSGSNAAASLAAEDAADGSNGGSNASLAKLEAAAVTAMAAAVGGWDVGLGLYTKKSAAAAAAAGHTADGDVDRSEGSLIKRDDSNASSVASAGSSSNSNKMAGCGNRIGSIVSRDGSSSSGALLDPANAAEGLRARKATQGPQTAAAAAAAAADSSALEEAALLAAVDSWDAAHGSKCGCCSSSRGPPPGITDFFVLLVVLGLIWVVLGQVLH